MLALSVAGRHDFSPPTPRGGTRDGYVAVLMLQTGALDMMPGLTTAAKQSATLAWASTRRLVLGLRVSDTADRLVLWTPGDRGGTLLPRVLPHDSAATSLAVVAAP
jgi:hypothetical protein